MQKKKIYEMINNYCNATNYHYHIVYNLTKKYYEQVVHLNSATNSYNEIIIRLLNIQMHVEFLVVCDENKILKSGVGYNLAAYSTNHQQFVMTTNHRQITTLKNSVSLNSFIFY